MRGTPYLYVFDGSALVNGANYTGLTLPLHSDSAFILRQVSGMNSIAAQWRMHDPVGRPCWDGMQWMTNAVLTNTYNHPVVPEIEYPRGGNIRLDLGAVARWDASPLSAARIFYPAQAIFQGVKLTGGPAASELHTEPAGGYRNILPCTYVFQLALNWRYWFDWPVATIPNVARDFRVPVQDRNFWLCGVNILRSTGIVPQDSVFAVMLYGADRETPLMSAPVVQWHINSSRNEDVMALFTVPWASHFPYPGVFYPKGGEIRMSIISLIANDDADFPRAYEIHLFGVRGES